MIAQHRLPFSYEEPVDTTVKLWDYYYKVRIPYVQSRSLQHLKRYGVALTGISEIDRDIQNEWITTMFTINMMVDMYKEGVPIKVVSIQDTKEIYHAISDHILAWKSQLERGINIGDAPIDDLIAMDEFANLVYEHAKYQFTREIVDSMFVRTLKQLQPFKIGQMFDQPAISYMSRTSSSGGDGTIVINGETEPLPERESLSTFFKQSLITFRR